MMKPREVGTEPTLRVGAWVQAVAAATLAFAGLITDVGPATAQSQVIEMTLERMVELGLRDSYRLQQLELDVERTRFQLQAEQAGLKSRVQLQVSAPEFESISEYEYDSQLGRNALIHQNTRRWEADLSVRQPVILFGYPTNGELSLNSRIYRYTQYDEERDIRYYNRYFIGYEQPLFQPNELKNNLEEAELDLESSQLEYVDDVVDLIADFTNDYYRLLESAYERVIAEEQVEHLERVAAAAQGLAATDPSREIEADQVQVELINAREELQSAVSSFRLQAADLKQELRLPTGDSITLNPSLVVTPVTVDVDHAIELASTLTSRLRQLQISRRENEIRLEEARGRNSFRVDLEFTYGREVQDPRFQNLWSEPTNSYTVDVSAFIPIWDWGQRKYRIEASRISLRSTDLRYEQELTEIVTDVQSEIRNLDEYQQRALNMEQNMSLAHQTTESTLARYEAGEVALVDLLQTINRETGTRDNYLDAYLGYRRALQDLQELTYYDFETDMPLVDRFGIQAEDQLP